MSDEIAVCMNESQFNLLREMLWKAYHASKYDEKLEARYREFFDHICGSSEPITLSWLDKKREEFP